MVQTNDIAHRRTDVALAPRTGVQGLRTPRSAGIAGVAFSILFTIAFVCTRLVTPPDPADAGTWLTDSMKKNVALVGLALAPFAGIAFLWFIGVVRSRIGDAEDRFFATVFLGSGLLFIALFLASLAITTGLVQAATSGDSQKLANSGVWAVGRHVTEAVLEAALVMAGVFTTAASTIILRTGAVPRWLGLGGTAVAIVMVLDTQRFEPWVVLAFPAWVLVLSLAILSIGLRERPDGYAQPSQ